MMTMIKIPRVKVALKVLFFLFPNSIKPVLVTCVLYWVLLFSLCSSAIQFKCLINFRVKEERFWRNYFYRVSLIKQSTQLSSLADQGLLKNASLSQFFANCFTQATLTHFKSISSSIDPFDRLIFAKWAENVPKIRFLIFFSFV